MNTQKIVFFLSLLTVSLFAETREECRKRRAEEWKQSLSNTTPADAIKTLGVNRGSPITNGFVFLDGRYIPPPYIVKREGNGVLINDKLVEERFPWPMVKETPPDPVTELPKMPTTITEKSTNNDHDVQIYTLTVRDYYLQKYGEAEIAKYMMPIYQAMPCVEKVLPGANSRRILVFWKREGTPLEMSILLVPPKRKPIEWTPEQIITTGNRTKEIYEERLQRNDYFIFPTLRTKSNRITGTQEGFLQIFIHLIPILETSTTGEEVFTRMEPLNIVNFSMESAKAFFENRDSITPELKQRVEALRLEQEALRLEQEERAKRLQKLREEAKAQEKLKKPITYKTR